ncbi:MAG: CDP-alcohol phosphatidyltransferase family protein [Deltaproteobacteria bacterium]|nr:CDP-alcohol phosphatidyltransferase family protein [Deltaproteobacteria bacterium]
MPGQDKKGYYLYELIKDLKRGHFRPAALRNFILNGVAYGVGIAWQHKNLRHSFYLVTFALFILLAFIGGIFYFYEAERFLPIAIAEGILFVVTFFLTLLQLGLVRTESGELYDRFVLPNVLTLVRLLMIPYLFFGIFLHQPGTEFTKLLFFLFGATALTDIFDGLIGRKLGLTSDFGRIYDPVIDVMFNSFLYVSLYVKEGGFLPHWFFWLVMVRYCFPPLAGFFLYLFNEPFRVKSTVMGKLSSFSLSIYLAFFLFHRGFTPDFYGKGLLDSLLIAAGVINVLTILAFVFKGIRLVKKT